MYIISTFFTSLYFIFYHILHGAACFRVTVSFQFCWLTLATSIGVQRHRMPFKLHPSHWFALGPSQVSALPILSCFLHGLSLCTEEGSKRSLWNICICLAYCTAWHLMKSIVFLLLYPPIYVKKCNVRMALSVLATLHCFPPGFFHFWNFAVYCF